MKTTTSTKFTLMGALLVGVAIGVLCQRWPRAGKPVLAGVGLLQTIPSLALLVLLMPIVAALGYRSVGEGSVTSAVDIGTPAISAFDR